MTSQPPLTAWRQAARGLWALAMPICFVQVGQHLLSVVDTALAGQVSEVAVGAVGLGGSLFFAVAIMGLGLVLGSDPLTSQALGAGDHHRAQVAMFHGIYVALLVAVPLGLLVIFVTTQLERIGISTELAQSTRLYVSGRIWSLIPLLVGVALRTYLQALRHTRPIVIAVIVTNILNAIADWLLIFGDEGLVALGLAPVGLPKLGVLGVGWASTAAALAQMIVFGLAVRASVRASDGVLWPRPQWPIIRSILRLGTPQGLQLTAEVGIFATVGTLVGRFGANAMAGHQVALSFASLTFSVTLGIGMATSVQVGRAIGAQDQEAARRSGFVGIATGALFMVAAALVMGFFAPQLASLVTDKPHVMKLAVGLIYVACAFQIVDGIQAVAAGALRGAGHTRFSFVSNVVGHWLIGLPAGLALAHLAGLGPKGLWWGLTFGLSFVGLALFWKFSRLARVGFARLAT